MIPRLIHRHKEHWLKGSYALRSIVSLGVFLFCVFFIQPYAVQFATEHASNPVTDVILSNIPIYNVDGFFVYGMFLLIAVVTLLCLFRPNRTPFVLNSLSLFVIIRSIFVSLTHLAPYATHVSEFSPAVTRAFFGADLFFSGHTGAPFLLALIFWHYKPLRYVFLAWSGFFAVVVLLGHFHYSIDVLAAFFITYSIYKISLWLFPKDREVFMETEPLS